jgi:hypothetical protein
VAGEKNCDGQVWQSEKVKLMANCVGGKIAGPIKRTVWLFVSDVNALFSASPKKVWRVEYKYP